MQHSGAPNVSSAKIGYIKRMPLEEVRKLMPKLSEVSIPDGYLFVLFDSDGTVLVVANSFNAVMGQSMIQNRAVKSVH